MQRNHDGRICKENTAGRVDQTGQIERVDRDDRLRH